MSDDARFPQFFQVVLDCPNARQLADFYRELLGYAYRPGHETVDPAGDDWLVIVDPNTGTRVAFQQVDSLPTSTWPDNDSVPQQLHLDLTVPHVAELDRQHDRVLSLGGRLAFDRSDDAEEPLRVYADPAGHPFCIFVA
jgi:catechol 2,3-dioxygenase-like lactoylglutathione lyase family enzyme